jgi:hypothetical protein
MWWVVNATPRPLHPRERPGTHYIGGWVDLKAGLERCGKSRHRRDSIPVVGTVQPVARRDTDYTIPAHDIQQDQNLNFHRRAEYPESCKLCQPCPWNSCSKNKCGISVRARQNVYEDGRGVGLLHNVYYSTTNGFLWRYSRLFKNWNNSLSLPHRIPTNSVRG